MPYTKTIYVDRETPLNAENFNKSETALEQGSKDIEILSNAAIELSNKIEKKANISHDHDGTYADKGHTHTVNWNDVVGKPTLYTVSLSVSNLTDSEGLVTSTVTHNLNCENVLVKAFGSDKHERFIATEKVSVNAVKIWTDTKEALDVFIYPIK